MLTPHPPLREEFGTSLSPFIAGTSIQWAWDSTSLGLLKECPRKYYYTMVEGWKPKENGVHLFFGTVFHSGLEEYDKAKALGASHEDAIDAALTHVLAATWINGQPWASDPEAEDFNPNKNRYTLVRSVLWYLFEYENDGAHTVILANGKPAVELSFRFETDYVGPDNQPFMLSGHLDRLVEFAGDTFVMDRKTTKSTISSYYFRQYSPDNQMSLYTLAGKVIYNIPVSGVIIDAAQIAVGFTSYARGITMRSNAQLEEWLDSTYEWFATAQRYAERGVWPMNEKSCSNYGECPFRKVCCNDPGVRQSFLETYFEKRRWNPLQVRNSDE